MIDTARFHNFTFRIGFPISLCSDCGTILNSGACWGIQSCCGGKGVIRWNDTDRQWKCTDCGKPSSNDPYFYSNRKDPSPSAPQPSFNDIFKGTPWIPKKCTCGSTAVGSNKHSDWCDIK